MVTVDGAMMVRWMDDGWGDGCDDRNGDGW